jgi:hypothetical protein
MLEIKEHYKTKKYDEFFLKQNYPCPLCFNNFIEMWFSNIIDLQIHIKRIHKNPIIEGAYIAKMKKIVKEREQLNKQLKQELVKKLLSDYDA